MDKVKWDRCSGCKRIKVCEANLWKLRALCGAGVAASTAAGVVALPLVGFGSGGVVAGSLAASWQSSIGAVTAGSLFAILQSLGATGLGLLLFGGIGTALGLLATLAVKLDWCDDEKANLRIMKIDNICKGGGKSTYQLRISHIKNLVFHLSQKFEQGDVKWEIGANIYTSIDSAFLGIDLVGNKPCEIIRMVARISSIDRKKKIQKVLGPQKVEIKGLFIINIPMEALLKPENGFVEDDSIIVDVEITDGKYLTTSPRPELHKLFSEPTPASKEMFNFFGRNQTNLKVKDMKKSCKDGCVTTLQMTVANIKNLTSVINATFKQKDNTWDIRVSKFDHHLGIAFIPKKACKTRIVVQLQPWNKSVEPIERTILDKFYAPGELKSINDFILWHQLTDYENGFIRDSSLIFEVEMTDGIFLDNPHDEDFKMLMKQQQNPQQLMFIICTALSFSSITVILKHHNALYAIISIHHHIFC